MEEKKKLVEEILSEYVEPQLVRHGGGLSLMDIRNHTAYIKFMGNCSGCPSAKYTLETIVKKEVLKRTDAVEDVRLVEEISDELYTLAKKILRHQVEI